MNVGTGARMRLDLKDGHQRTVGEHGNKQLTEHQGGRRGKQTSKQSMNVYRWSRQRCKNLESQVIKCGTERQHGVNDYRGSPKYHKEIHKIQKYSFTHSQKL